MLPGNIKLLRRGAAVDDPGMCHRCTMGNQNVTHGATDADWVLKPQGNRIGLRQARQEVMSNQRLDLLQLGTPCRLLKALHVCTWQRGPIVTEIVRYARSHPGFNLAWHGAAYIPHSP